MSIQEANVFLQLFLMLIVDEDVVGVNVKIEKY